MSNSLRSRVLRRAFSDPDFRPQQVLAEEEGLSSSEKVALRSMMTNPVPVQTPAPVIQQPSQPIFVAPTTPAPVAPAPVVPAPVPVSNPDSISALGVPERTHQGFRDDILPELERLATLGVSRVEAGVRLSEAVRNAFSSKDMLYNILIRYQSSFESDLDFLEGLETLIESWVALNPEV